MKRLMVTGGCGFIGANFIHYLLDWEKFPGVVVNVDKLTYAGNVENLKTIAEKYPDQYRFVHGDICDAKQMETVFADHGIDAVCHFAAESHVDRSIVGPDAFIRTNIQGTFTLLETARKFSSQLELFHHVSTDEVYGSLGPTGAFTEQTPYRPNSPYAASKAGSDHLVRAYSHTYGLPVTLSNCSNNYGPYQFPEKLIPLMILNALEEKPLPVYGKGENIRDWLYVTDHCRAIWMVMQHGRRGDEYNVGGQCERTNLDVVTRICDMVDEIKGIPPNGPRRRLITFVKDRPGHDLRYAIDFTKIRDELAFEPKESFETGLKKTIQWYLDHPGWVERIRSGAYMDWMKSQYNM